MYKRPIFLVSSLALLVMSCALQTKFFGVADVVELGADRAEEPEGEVLPLASGTPEGVEVRGGDEAAMRELLGRTLHYGIPGAERTLILVGELPEDLPFDMPLPEKARVIGSVDRGYRHGTEMYLDVDLPPEETVDYFRLVLAQGGWEFPEEDGRERGFVSGSPSPAQKFCHKAIDSQLWLRALTTPGGSSDLRITYHPTTDYSTCMAGIGAVERVQRIMPALVTPPGSRTLGGGSSSSSTGMGDISTTFETDLPAEEIEDHYSSKLLEQGWQKLGGGTAETAAWSFWRLEGEGNETWIGTLLVVERLADEDERLAWFSVELEEPGD